MFQGGTNPERSPGIIKDKYTITKKSGEKYWFKCNKIECEDDYIVGLSKTF